MYHDLYLVSLSGLLLNQININLYQASQINTISSYINNIKIPNNDNYLISLSGSINLLKPYLIDNSYYNFYTISGFGLSGALVYRTLSSYIYEPSLINYHTNQLVTISSYLLSNNNKLLYHDLYLLSISSNLSNYIVTNNNSINLNNNKLLYHDLYLISISSNLSNYIVTNNNSINLNNNKLLYHDLYLISISSNISSNIATVSYVNNYFLTLSSNIYNFKPPNYDLQFVSLSNSLLLQSNINQIQANQINSISSYIVANNNNLNMFNNYFATLSSNILFQSNINQIQANQINTISSYIVTNNNKLSYYNLYLYSLSASIKAQSTGSILDSQLSSNVCLLTSTQTLTNKTLTNCRGLTMNSNFNITLSGNCIIDGTLSTGQCIFNTLKFNNSTSNQQITLYENSPTDSASNYFISVEGSRIRYNVNSGATHLFSTGTGVSTYSTHVSINSNGLTMAGNRNMFQSGTGILSQTGTGINLMKNITMNADQNLLQSGIGVITQTGTGTNAFKGSTFAGSNTHYNGSAINLYNSTNTSYTQLIQSGVNYFISNSASGGSILLRTLNATGTANDFNINASDIICDKYFYIYNNKALVLKDTNNITQSNLSQFNGTLFLDNYSTNGENYITFRTYDTQATPIHNVRMSIRYDAVAIQNATVLRIFNASNTNYLQAEQYLFNSYISNFANANVASNSGTQAIVLRTCNTSGGLTENMIVQHNKITCNQALQVNNGFTLTGSLSLPNNSVSDSFLTSNVPLKNATSNIFVGTIILSKPLQLQSDYSTYYPNQSSNYLGCIVTGTFTTAFTLSTNGVYNLASVTIGPGVWMITGITGVLNTHITAIPIVTNNLSISQSAVYSIDNACCIIDSTSYYRNSNFIKQISRVVTNTTPYNAIWNLNIKCTFSSGTIEYNASSASYSNIYAVRIA